MNNRKIEKTKTTSISKWFGNMSVIEDFLLAKSWCSPWAIFKLINSYFRALGVVAFANNPLTGILIFCALIYGNPHVAIASVMTGVISILTCKLIRAKNEDVCTGASVFNSILVGCIMTVVLPPTFGVSMDVKFWLFIGVAGFVTNFIDQGLQAIMAPSRLPVQSVPFNMVATFAFLIFRAKFQGFELGNVADFNVLNDNQTVDWNLVFQGTICGTGQIYGVGNLTSSILIWLGFFLYSPLLTLMFYVGSVTGAILAVMFSVQPLSEIYVGLWSYNSLLASGGVVFFIYPTPLSIVLSIVSAIVAVSAQAAVTPLFLQTSLPVYSYPFNIAIMFILAISLKRESVYKFIENRTYPEEHMFRYYKSCGSRDYFEDDDEEENPLQVRTKS